MTDYPALFKFLKETAFSEGFYHILADEAYIEFTKLQSRLAAADKIIDDITHRIEIGQVNPWEILAKMQAYKKGE